MSIPTILISDDSPIVGEAIAWQLKRSGVEVLLDKTSDVHAMARLHKPDLILLDLEQGIDGRELLQGLKDDPETSGIEVVAMVGAEHDELRWTCLQQGALALVPKPFRTTFVATLTRLAQQAFRTRP